MESAAEPVRDAGGGPGTVTAAVALRTALVAVRAATAGQTARAWKLVTIDDLARTSAMFGAIAAAVLGRGQRASVRVADVWAARFFGRPATGLDPSPFLGLAGSPLAPPDVLAAVSASSSRRALAAGRDDETALAAGLVRVERIVTTEVYRSGTDALVTLAEAEGSPGWRRSTTGSACPVCRAAADGTLQDWSAELALHPFCSCLAEVVR